MLKQYVFVNAPKEWFKFITKHLQIQLDKKHLNLKDMYTYLNAKQLEIEDYKPFYPRSMSKLKILICPLGLIRGSSEDSFYPLFRIAFLLDVKLCLNLTFHQIHLEFRHLYSCAVCEVRVMSKSSDKHQDFRYCGIHSNMINYPQNINVYLYLTKDHDAALSSLATVYNVTAFYSVIDTKMIVTLERHRFLWRNLVWHLHLLPKNIRVMKFELKTKKFQHLIIKFTNNIDLIVEVFDGPGTHY